MVVTRCQTRGWFPRVHPGRTRPRGLAGLVFRYASAVTLPPPGAVECLKSAGLRSVWLMQRAGKARCVLQAAAGDQAAVGYQLAPQAAAGRRSRPAAPPGCVLAGEVDDGAGLRGTAGRGRPDGFGGLRLRVPRDVNAGGATNVPALIDVLLWFGHPGWPSCDTEVSLSFFLPMNLRWALW